MRSWFVNLDLRLDLSHMPVLCVHINTRKHSVSRASLFLMALHTHTHTYTYTHGTKIVGTNRFAAQFIITLPVFTYRQSLVFFFSPASLIVKWSDRNWTVDGFLTVSFSCTLIEGYTVGSKIHINTFSFFFSPGRKPRII